MGQQLVNPDGCCSQTAWDLAIVGSGAARFAAAIRGRSLGARVVMVERGTVGAPASTWGAFQARSCCGPPSSTTRPATTRARARPPAPGRRIGGPWWPRRTGWSTSSAARNTRTWPESTRGRSFGGKRASSRGRSSASGRSALRASHYLVATGSSPLVPDLPNLPEAGYLTSTTAMELEDLPRSLLVVGAGFVALELGQLFARLGAQVVMVRRGSGLLEDHEPEVGASMLEALGDLGIEFLPHTRLLSVESGGVDRKVRAQVMGRDRTFEVDHVLMAAGRRPNTGGLGRQLGRAPVVKRIEIPVLSEDAVGNGNVKMGMPGHRVKMGPRVPGPWR
ncbi:MAG: NAD(P)/FAD-dependent oxidoreductase [Armatimonadetes bacterium]|nr:NAD(P)/FAD-dependent oxidoreductase [Armatimonadota bacterium]